MAPLSGGLFAHLRLAGLLLAMTTLMLLRARSVCRWHCGTTAASPITRSKWQSTADGSPRPRTARRITGNSSPGAISLHQGAGPVMAAFSGP